MKGSELDRLDPGFVRDFNRSLVAHVRMEEYFRDMGLDVIYQMPNLRPDASQRRRFADNGDLHVWLPHAGGWVNMEIKWLWGKGFNSIEELKLLTNHPQDEIRVDPDYSFLGKKLRPYRYWFCNMHLTGAAVLDVDATFADWNHVPDDFSRKRERAIFFVKIDRLTYLPLGHWKRNPPF